MVNSKFYILQEVYDVVMDRKIIRKRILYQLFIRQGTGQDFEKVGEEASEVIIGAKNENKDEIRYEIADLIYHLTVLMIHQGLTWEDICEELQSRR